MERQFVVHCGLYVYCARVSGKVTAGSPTWAGASSLLVALPSWPTRYQVPEPGPPTWMLHGLSTTFLPQAGLSDLLPFITPSCAFYLNFLPPPPMNHFALLFNSPGSVGRDDVAEAPPIVKRTTTSRT